MGGEWTKVFRKKIEAVGLYPLYHLLLSVESVSGNWRQNVKRSHKKWHFFQAPNVWQKVSFPSFKLEFCPRRRWDKRLVSKWHLTFFSLTYLESWHGQSTDRVAKIWDRQGDQISVVARTTMLHPNPCGW